MPIIQTFIFVLVFAENRSTYKDEISCNIIIQNLTHILCSFERIYWFELSLLVIYVERLFPKTQIIIHE